VSRFSCIRPLHLLFIVLLLAPLAWGQSKTPASKARKNPSTQKPDKKGPPSTQPPVPPPPACTESLDVTPGQDSRIVLPGVHGDAVRLRATLKPCPGAPFPDELRFNVTRSDGGEWGGLGKQTQEKPGSYVIDWKPGDDGQYRIEVLANTPGTVKKEMTVTVVTSCTPACESASHECTRSGECVSAFSGLVIVAPTQEMKLMRGELASVRARLERKPRAKSPYPEQLTLQVTRGEGGEQTPVTLSRMATAEDGMSSTYSNLWTPAETGEYTLKVQGAGLSAETKVKVGRSWATEAYISAGVGGVAVLGAVVLGLLAGNANGKINDEYLNGAAPTPERAAGVGVLRDRVKSYRTGALLSAGLAVAGGGVALFLWPSHKPSEAQTQAKTSSPGTASLSIGPGGVGLHVLLP